MHFNRIGCRLHNLQAYFTCAQPPIRPYSAHLLSRFSPSPFPPSTHRLPFPPCTQPPSSNLLGENVSRFPPSTRNVYEQMPLPDLFQPALDLSTKEASIPSCRGKIVSLPIVRALPAICADTVITEEVGLFFLFFLSERVLGIFRNFGFLRSKMKLED